MAMYPPPTLFHYDNCGSKKANVVTQARVSLELPTSSRFPGGSGKDFMLHRSQRSQILLLQLHRVELKSGQESTNHYLHS